MGVTGLWKLIESSGKPVPVETLENKVLAIDLSIWLHQVVKGFQDNKGGNLPNAHLLGLFHRLCKLLYYRVKPVFVFDGGVPQLKRETIAKRSQSRNKLQSEADRIQELIIQNLVRDKVVQKALGQEVCEALISPSKQQKPAEKPNKDDMFKLPCLKVENYIDQDEPATSYSSYTDTSDADSSYDEKNLRSTYHINLQAIDVTSEHFKNLPADVRHEILTDIKDMRKQSSWARLHELPAGAYDFSGFQMKRLLKRRQVQVSLEEAEQQMEGKSLTLAELEALMSEEGILNAPYSDAARRIASDENTRFLLVKDLKKAYENAQKNVNDKIKKEEDEDMKKVKQEKGEELKEEKEDDQYDSGGSENLGLDYELELQKAIAMSLETTQVYKDNDYDENVPAKLNNAQREELKTASNSLARAYMIEYAGMTDEEIRDMVQDEQASTQTEELQASFNFQHNDRFVLKGEICTPYKDMPAIKEKARELTRKSLNMQDEVEYISSSSDDSDLEEVEETPNSSKTNLEIIVDPAKTNSMETDDDLFADIFENDDAKEAEKDPIAEIIQPVSDEMNVSKMSTESSNKSTSESLMVADKRAKQDNVDIKSVSANKIDDLETSKRSGESKSVEIPSCLSNANDISEKPKANEAESEAVEVVGNDVVENDGSTRNSTSTVEDQIPADFETLEENSLQEAGEENSTEATQASTSVKNINKIRESSREVNDLSPMDASNPMLESPLPNLMPATNILSPDINMNKAKEILDKLRDEINKVQCITLDAIEISKDSLEKVINAENLSEGISQNPLLKVITDEKSKINNTGIENKNQEKDVNIVCTNEDGPKTIENESDLTKSETVENKIEKDAKLKESTIKPNVTLPTQPPSKLDEILQSVKKQTTEVVNISLDDITPLKNDSFVINDSDDSDVEVISPSTQKPSSQNSASEVIEIFDDYSNGLKSPSKISTSQSTINDFFHMEFAVKKTPEKETEKEESPPPNVASPFFVNKSPSNSKKRPSPASTSNIGPSKVAKVSKQLFEEEKVTIKVEDEIRPAEAVTTEADVIEEAAKVLRDGKTQSELEDIASDIRKENKELEMERNRQNRMASSITDKMAHECKQLLRLFGVPYIVAPMEAEAQCAFLDLINLTDGTITDDSDVWLFGGQTVYKNFFNQKKHVLEFKIENIEKLFNMDRHKLIQLAMLVGSDYTTGINGIGAVTAIEILANFPITPMKEGEVTEIMSILSSLRKFRDWWQACKITKGGERSALRSKLKNVELHEGFPNMNIVEAYLRPTVDDNREKFAWGEPDIETIREFAKTKFGWTRNKTDEILQPVLKKLKERKTQASIKNYFSVKSATTVRDLKVSKRVMTAIDKMSGDYVEPPPTKPKERKTRKKKAPAIETTTEDPSAESAANNDEIIDLDDAESSPPKPKQRRTRKGKQDQDFETINGEAKNDEDVDVFVTPATPKKKPVTRKRGAKAIVGQSDNLGNIASIEKVKPPKLGAIGPAKKKVPIIPNPNQPIPQREKDKREMQLKKEKAIEIFKQKKAEGK